MPAPKSVVKINKKGVQYTSSVLRAKYTLEELTRAALKDCGKLLSFRARDKARAIAGRSLKRSNRVKNAFQYWVRKRETDLVIGIKHDTWYGVDQELGTKGQQKRDILRKTVMENIGLLREIQSQYLELMEDEAAAESVINENSEVADGQDD
jgi:hypothetical protein